MVHKADLENLLAHRTAHAARLDLKLIEYKVWGRKLLSGPLNLTIYPGEFVGLLGPSGSGKSTLLKLCCGIQRPTQGQVLLNQQDLYQHQEIWRYKIGYVPQDDIIHQELTVSKAVHYAARLRLDPSLSAERRQALVNRVIHEVGLGEKSQLKIQKLSGGQRKRASVAIELLTRPAILYLDEPTSGQDPQLEEALMKVFQKVAQDGTTVLITTHAMASVELLGLVVLLREGRLVYFGPPQDLLDYFEVRSYEGVFKQLQKDSVAHWLDKYRLSTHYQRYIVGRAQSWTP